MADTTHVSDGLADAPVFEAPLTRQSDSRPWPMRTAILFWLGTSAVAWAVLIGMAVLLG